MKRLFCIFLVASFSLAVLQAQQPTIAAGGIYNVASYTPSGLPGAAIAQGALFVLFGTNLGPAALAQPASLPLSTTFGGTSISVTVNGTTTKPYLVYTSAGQVCALLPSSTPVGAGTLTVTYNGQSSAAAPIQVASSSVGIFSLNQQGSGPGIVTSAAYVVAGLTNASSAGDVDIIWATGLGATANTGSEAAGTAPLATLPSTFSVYVGGVQAAVVAAARSTSPGLDQIAFTVPSGVTGCHVPVVVQTGTTVSNFVTMSIGANGICTDTPGLGIGLTPTQITQLESKGTVAAGGITLSRSASPALSFSGISIPATTTDSGAASFSKYTFTQYSNSLGGGLNVTTYGACTVYSFTGNTTTVTDPVMPIPLDAGATLTLTGPGGTRTLTKLSPGVYDATLGGGSGPTATPLYLSPGTYTVSGQGGADVGPINTSIDIPALLNWTNSSSISTINRASGQLITWTGGDSNGSVYITGFSFVTSGSSTVGSGFYCIAPTSALQFTIPSIVLLSMPPSGAGGILSGALSYLGVGDVSAYKQFTATGLDFGYIGASSSAAQYVTYQ